MADDLHRLVTLSSQQEKPFVLVGSELGAMVARFYTQLYPRCARTPRAVREEGVVSGVGVQPNSAGPNKS